jgi:uncharacterized protein (TIGR03435 family)
MKDHTAHHQSMSRRTQFTISGVATVTAILVYALAIPSRTSAQNQAAPSSPAGTPAPQPAAEPPLAFEVASIKENHDVYNRVGISFSRGSFTATGVPLKMLISSAYSVRPFQISGGPNWINTTKYNIDAKMPDGLGEQIQNLPQDQRREKMSQLIQSLLTDRFHLKVSHETREGPVYDLVVAKNGPLLHESKPGDNNSNEMKGPDGKPVHGNFIRMMPGELEGQAVAIEFLATSLSQQLGRKVVDQTGLKGNYDFDLKWAPDQGPGGPGGMMGAGPGGPPPGSPGGDAPPPADSSGPSIFTAVQEQLGLKLESAKGQVEMLVIDSVEKPSED